MLNAEEGDYLLWNIERTITKIYIPVLLDSCMNDKGTKDLLTKVNSLHLIGIEYVFRHNCFLDMLHIHVCYEMNFL